MDSFHDFEQAGWQQAADYYSDAFGSLTSQTIAPLLDAARAAPGVRVLDVATGPGYVAAAAADRGAAVVGVDFSSAMIALARRRYRAIVFREGDAEELPFPNDCFDAVTMNFGLLHLARPETALTEARRVLAAGGRCAFTVWANPEESVGFRIVLRAIETHGRMDVPLPPGPPFFRFSDPQECSRSLSDAGFVGPQVDRLPLIWRFESADALHEAFSRGAVRTAALLRGQTADAAATIRGAIRDEVERYRRGEAIELPLAAVLASATKPSSHLVI